MRNFWRGERPGGGALEDRHTRLGVSRRDIRVSLGRVNKNETDSNLTAFEQLPDVRLV
jgi:hypothetical protein